MFKGQGAGQYNNIANEENEHHFKSPLSFKGAMEQRFCFTEAKVPFKNTTNDTNLPSQNQFGAMPQSPFTADKKGMNQVSALQLLATCGKT